jgi:hypothetical protein
VSLTVAACAESPTAPTPSADGIRPSETGAYRPGGGTCDPWQDLNWCEDPDEPCMTSDPSTGEPEEFVGVQGCPGEGPGGPGGGSPPETQPPADTACKHTDAAVNDPNVQAGLKNLWQQSNPNLSQDQRLENAGWIVQNPDGTRTVTPFSYSAQGPCEVNGNMFAPAGAVGWVHTHPFRKDEEMVICGPIKIRTMDGRWIDLIRSDGRLAYEIYRNQPSQLDRELMSNVNAIRRARNEPVLEGYVIDADKITRYGGGTGSVSWDRCGY